MAGPIARFAGVAVMTLALAGCSSMGNMFGASDDASYADVNASQSEVAQAAQGVMPAIATQCPPIEIRAGAEYTRSFAGNRTSDPSALRYQGVIDRVSRNCVVSNGVITVSMGAVGRVILGPSGAEGNITVPVRFAVQRDDMLVFSERYDITVSATRSSANEFSKTLENVAIPYVGGESINIYVGFDSR